MRTVITVSLNGNAYQLDEAAHAALRAYLGRAETTLHGNVDLAEILADIEQAIAEKCQRCLGPHKTVVTDEEMRRILEEMGPVDSGATAGARDHQPQEPTAPPVEPRRAPSPRRLYRIRAGEWLGGVCTGLEAYFGYDATLVRIGFVAFFLLVAALTESPVGAVLYAALWLIVPYADTSEEQAAAHGQPFNAREIIDRVRKEIAALKDDAGGGRSEWRRRRHEWRRQWRIQQLRWKGAWRDPWVPDPAPFARAAEDLPYATRVIAGATIPLFGLLSAGLFLLMAVALMSLTTDGTLLGRPLPPDLPRWAAVLLVVVLYLALVAPLRAARRAAYQVGARQSVVWAGLIEASVVFVILWLAYQNAPEFRELVHGLIEFLRRLLIDLGDDDATMRAGAGLPLLLSAGGFRSFTDSARPSGLASRRLSGAVDRPQGGDHHGHA